jgi:hypothetical protein
MAKKKTKNKLKLDIDFACEVKATTENISSFEKFLKKNELCLNIEYEFESISMMMSIYSDQIEGGFSVKKIDDFTYSISAKGYCFKDDDFDHTTELKKLNLSPIVMLNYVSDLSLNSYFINGDEDLTIPIGKVVV